MTTANNSSSKVFALLRQSCAQLNNTGVAYGPSLGDNALENTNQCQIDAGFMKELGLNAIRVYTVGPTADHDGCMQAFASQGIYVWIGLSTPLTSISRVEPEWTLELFDAFSAAVDTFSGYNNTLAFDISNEVISLGEEDTLAAPYIKAATRDIKAYRDARGYRKIPIGYNSADIVRLQSTIADYFACGDEADAIEIFGMNTFAWCGNSSYAQSGYDSLYQDLQNLNIPSVFTETGCNTESPRTWSEVSVMLGAVLPSVFSGVMVYEWHQEVNEYGLVQYEDDTQTGFPETLADYENLQRVLSTVSPASTAATAYTPSNSAPSCPTTASDWSADPSAPLPTIAALNLQTVSAVTTIAEADFLTAATSTNPSSPTSPSQSPEVGTLEEGGQPSSQPDGLETGAIVGIAVGGAAVGLGLVAGIFFWLRRRRRRGTSATAMSSGAEPYNEKPELHGVSTGRRNERAELASASAKAGLYPSRPPQEIMGSGRHTQLHPYEMEGSNPYREMEDSSNGSQGGSSAVGRAR
jgi:1,3-beta-glucanosyltransferase GAS1